MYWYELIHRPISIGTQPNGYTDYDHAHVNRNGFRFGKVAYTRPLSMEERNEYNLEPVHVPGMVEISMVTQPFLNDNAIKITVNVLHYLIENNMMDVLETNTWKYIHLDGLKSIAAERKTELKIIYKNLKNNLQNG